MLSTREDKQEQELFEYTATLNAMRDYLNDILSEAHCIDDVQSDVYFEVKYYIERNYFTFVDVDEIEKALYELYNLQVCL